MRAESTIVACATGVVRAGVSVVRVSGPCAHEVANALCKRPVSTVGQACLRTFHDAKGGAIDKGLVLIFKAPASFTGEDTAELHTHGSPYIVERVIQACIDFGAQMARPGEFTERAFLNGKMDLVQAESVADLIASQTSAQAEAALASLQGVLSQKIQTLQQTLIGVRTQVEAAIDFSEQDVETSSRAWMQAQLETLVTQAQALTEQVRRAVHTQAGLRCVMFGAPNAGKSSLLNQITQQDHAIVTDIPGTTRDTLKACVAFKGNMLEITDTAGIRKSEDAIEMLGIERTHKAVQQADVVWLLVDLQTTPVAQIATYRQELPPEKRLLVVGNKVDLLSEQKKKDWQQVCDCQISARDGVGIDSLLELTYGLLKDTLSCEFSARERHLNALLDFQAQVQAASAVMETQLDCVAEELRHAQQHLSKITGEFHSEDLLDAIFGTFCLGK
jgi:tRNA modification GTPase